MEWAQREREREIEEKCGEVIKKGREEEERERGENEERRVYLNPEGRGLSCFEEEFGYEGVDTWFWNRKERRKMGE